MSKSFERGPFQLGDVVSGEPQLYCGYVPPSLMPGGASILVAGTLIALCRRVFARARTFARRAGSEPAAITAFPSAPRAPAPAAAEERRAA
jgi:hypothetical protein